MSDSRTLDAALEIVSRHESAALATLEAATGGAPLCGVDGRRQTVKAREGAAAALADVRRALGRGRAEGMPARSGDLAQSVVDDVRAQWAGVTGPLATRPGSGEYLSGGLEALASLEVELRRTVADPAAGSKAPGAPARGADDSPPSVGLDVWGGPDLSSGIAQGPALSQVGGASRGSAARLRWPRRRRLVAGVILLALVVLVALTAGWPIAEEPLWSLLTAVSVVLSALALSLFVPRAGQGWRPDFGCAPCAAAGLALAVAGPWLAVETAHHGERAALAAVLSGAALARKLTEPPVCVARDPACNTPGNRKPPA